MSRRRVTFAPRALIDLAEIGEYLTLEAGERVASRLVGRIEAKTKALAANPSLGAADAVLGPEARRLVVAPYLIVYDHDETTVTVLRIIHGARDLPSLFGDNPV